MIASANQVVPILMTKLSNICNTVQLQVLHFSRKIFHPFLHNNIFKKDCTNVLFIYSSTLHKVLHSTFAAFTSQSIVLYCTKNYFILHKVLFIILHNCIACKCHLYIAHACLDFAHIFLC